AEEKNKPVEKEEKPTEKTQASKVEKKAESTADDKKKAKAPETPKIKKDEAVAMGYSLHLSKKHGMYLCSFIRNKKIDDAISDLEQVVKLKKAVPFKGEIPHRKGKGMMSGRYPVKGSGMFISMLKGLRGNVI